MTGNITIADQRSGGRATASRALPALLLLPAIVAVAVLFFVPILMLVWRSLSEPELGLQQYMRVFTDELTLTVLARTLWTTVLVTVITLVLGFPYAYAMTIAGPRVRAVLLAIVMIPFWLSVMTRTFAWVVLLARGGPVSDLAAGVGIPDLTLLGSLAGATIGMVQVLLPFMVLPLYSTMAGIDRNLLKAAGSLGAKGWTALRTVFLPLAVPGVTAGTTLVFVLCVGFYITPQLLGSPQNALVAQLIGIRVLQLRDFAGAGAVSAVLIVLCVILIVLASRSIKLTSMFGGRS